MGGGVRRDRELACLFVGSGPLDRVIGLRGLKPVAERRVGLGRNISAVAVFIK
jgi:hypothetical protein